MIYCQLQNTLRCMHHNLYLTKYFRWDSYLDLEVICTAHIGRCWQVFVMGLRSSSLHVAMIGVILRSTPVCSFSIISINHYPIERGWSKTHHETLSSLLTAHSVKQGISYLIPTSFWGSFVISCVLWLYLCLTVASSIFWLSIHFPCLPIELCCYELNGKFTHCIVLLWNKRVKNGKFTCLEIPSTNERKDSSPSNITETVLSSSSTSTK